MALGPDPGASSARADRELLDALTRDPAALGPIYDRYAGLVYGIAMAALRDEDEAQDLTQEIFLSLHRHATSYDPQRGALGALLTAMTRNRAIDRIRARARKLRLLENLHRSNESTSSSFSPLDRISIKECSERVQSALAALPETQRRVLEMAYYRGLSQSEIAADLDASLGTVKSWARRGLLSLKDALGDLLG